MARPIKLRIWRGNKDGGDFHTVTVDANEGEVVLDVIHRVQATQLPDLAVRWNCKAGKCGSCSMEINGKPRLACMTRMNSFEEGETITVTPLPLCRGWSAELLQRCTKRMRESKERLRPFA